ncbi:hypothetical protein BDR26DRAFT_866171 [Obelidium mucronatum]|nr:hypothetical protein BDR26DRAFT_866171 [Obelidium mucronatum]
MYEILTIHVSSWFASGAVVSWIVYGVLSKAIGGVSDGLFFGIVGAVSVAYVGVFVWWAPLWLEVSKWITLTHYYPRGTAVFCFFMGVGIMSTQLIVSRDGNGAALAIVVFAHLFHVIGLGLYGFACAAIVRVSKSFKSLFPQTRSENTSLLP